LHVVASNMHKRFKVADVKMTKLAFQRHQLV
jgi:hypothetical protein